MTVFLLSEKTVIVDTDQIQGNVLPGFKSDHEHLRGVRFRDPQSGRDWIQAILPHITTAEDVYAHRRQVGAGARTPAEHPPWATVAFTNSALVTLGFPATFVDDAFKSGMERAANRLGDDPAEHASWHVGGANPIDSLVLVAGQTAAAARKHADALCTARGVDVVYRDEGATLPNRRGHEHFGFRDGISHPGVFGVARSSGEPLTARDWTSVPDGPVLLAGPGAVLTWPGEFVFGWPGEHAVASRQPGRVKHAGAQRRDLTANGSYVVLRRLRQKVAVFHRVCADLAAELAPDWSELNPGLLEALIVGRWPSGAPVDARTTVPRDPGVTGDDIPNAFDFSTDPDGTVCPLAAHIRKVNPRAQAAVDVPPRFRRLMRRGIPYGDPPLDRHADDSDDRGLLFVSYQTSIINQFEGVVEDWMNDADRPAVTGAGHDILVGQVEGFRRMRLNHNGPVVLDADARWIIPSGGVYAFVPSIFALAHLAKPV